MALQTVAASIVGNLVDNPCPLPDATVIDPYVTPVLASGATQTTATAIASEINVVTNNTVANGVVLPVGIRGQRVIIYGALAVAGPIVYPPVGGKIGTAATNAGVALASGQARMYVCLDQTGVNWFPLGQ